MNHLMAHRGIIPGIRCATSPLLRDGVGLESKGGGAGTFQEKIFGKQLATAQVNPASITSQPKRVYNLVYTVENKNKHHSRFFSRCGLSYRFGAIRCSFSVNRTESHRRMFALFKSEPHRIVGFLISENSTESHRRIYSIRKPHRASP